MWADRILRQSRRNGRISGRLRCHPRFVSSYGAWLDNQSRLLMFGIIETWHRTATVERFQSPLSTHHFVERFLADLELATPETRKVQRSPDPAPRWIPPPMGLTKINVGAALSKNSNLASMAAVARDETGKFLGASVLVSVGITDPEVAEAIACREGLALASDLHLQRFRVATDCNNIITCLDGAGMGQYGHVIREIQATRKVFQLVQFVHEGRKSNADAHLVSRSSLYDSLGRHLWLLTPPMGVCNFISINNQ